MSLSRYSSLRTGFRDLANPKKTKVITGVQILCFTLFSITSSLGFAKPVVVLDDAHGGADAGVKSGSETEKDWNLKWAQSLRKALEEDGFEVVLIRQKDETIPQEKRAQMINNLQASAVIVLHAEVDDTGNRTGPMIVVEPPTQGGETQEPARWGTISPSQYRASLRLGRDISLALGLGAELSSLSDTRGLAGETSSPASRLFCLPHQSLRYLLAPAVVLTPLFLSSQADIKKFSDEGALDEFSEKVARGLANFIQ